MNAQDVIAEAICQSVRATNDPAMWARMDDDERAPFLEDAERVVAALTDAGFAVVELPKPTGQWAEGPEWRQPGIHPADFNRGDGWIVWTGKQPNSRVMVQRLEPGELTPDEANELAVSLLAAAHAERGDQ